VACGSQNSQEASLAWAANVDENGLAMIGDRMWTTMTVPGRASAGGAGFDVRKGFEEGEARELNAVAAILEALALSLAPAFDEAAVAQLRAANARFRRCAPGAGDAGDANDAETPADPVALAVADHDFHRRLSEPCGDERLLATLAPVRRAIYRWHTTVAPDPAAVERAAAEHDAIVDALERADHPTAAQRLREHVAAGLSGLLAAAQPRAGGDRERRLGPEHRGTSS
jgi:DNA-binding GntR family transcriptional regulator